MAIQISEDIIKALLDRGRRAPENPLMEQGAFTWGPGGTKRKAGTRDSKIIDSLLAQGTDSSPIQHPTQGMARVMAAIAGVKRERDLIGAEQQQQTERERMIMQLYGPQGDSQPPVTAPMQPQQPATPFVTQPGSVKPEQPFTPPVQEQQNPFGVAPGSVKPEQSFTQPTAAELPQNVMELTPQDINRLRKLVLTEAVHGLPDDVYNQQVGGIVDTALNRLRSGQWGKDLPSVLNAPYQFSDINGPVSWKSGRKGVDEIPDSWLNTPNGKRVAAALDAHLAARANTPPAIGGHLNYANPYYSDASNLSWINKLDGPKLGAGKAVHWHGTAGNQKPVDANYFLRVAGAQNQPPEAQPVSLNAQLPSDIPVEQMVQEAGIPQQPYQVAALGPTEAPTQMAQQQPVEAAQQFAQAPFSMNDVNAGNALLSQRQPQPIMPRAPAQAPVPQVQQQQAPQQRPQLDPRIIQAITNPWASKEERAIAMKLIEPHITPQQQQFSPLPNGMVLRKDPRSGRVEVVNPYSGQVVTDPQQIPNGLKQTQYGVTPQFAKKDGRLGMYQLGNDGSLKFHELPDNVDLAPGFDKVDAGTHYELRDKKTGQVVDVIKKNVAEVEKQKVVGKSEGETIANLPKFIDQADSFLDSIKGIKEDPGLDMVLGWGSVLPNIPNTDIPRIRGRLEQLKGKQFLQAFESLKGGGQITQIEGEKATNAMSRLKEASKPKDYRDALAELEEIITTARKRAIERASGAPQQQQAPQAAPQPQQKLDPLGIR